MNQKRKLLICDDKPINRYVLSCIFEDDYEILECKNGDEVLDTITKEKDEIAVVLLDLVMPDGDGFYVLDHMKENEYDQIPVVIVTANMDDAVIRKTFSYDIADYIQKPFQEDVVKQRVACVVKKYNDQNRLDVQLA